MSFFEEIIGGLFQEVLFGFIRKIGAAFRWAFLHNKYNYKEVLTQDWNLRIGILVILIFVSILFQIL